MSRPRFKLPDSAKTGDVIEVKTLIEHAMAPGYCYDPEGRLLPRHLIESFVVRYAGRNVFSAELHPGIAHHPYITFFMRVPGPGEFEFVWTEDTGATIIEK